MAAEGMPQRKIADVLGVSKKTVSRMTQPEPEPEPDPEPAASQMTQPEIIEPGDPAEVIELLSDTIPLSGPPTAREGDPKVPSTVLGIQVGSWLPYSRLTG